MNQCSYDDKSRDELIELLNYYKSEYVLVCNFYKHEKKEHRKTKNALKLFRDRSVELAKKLDSIRNEVV